MKKYVPHILILIILVGLFSPMAQVNAEIIAPTINGGGASNTTPDQTAPASTGGITAPAMTYEQTPATADTTAGSGIVAPTINGGSTATAPPKSAFEQQFDTATVCYTGGLSFDVGGCLVVVSYYLFYVVPSWLLTLSARFFNILVGITLYSTLYTKSTFIPTAWAIVRDLSNIFFILILLYIAIKTILGLGGSEVKKMIAHVIIMALLINFSMFFTQVIIDSSNILALIFYNKLQVQTPETAVAGVKDLSGAMVATFNPTSQLTMENFFNAAKTPPVGGLGPNQKGTCYYGFITKFGLYTEAECKALPLGPWNWKTVEINPATGLMTTVPSGIMLGLILVTGAIMLFAAYCFFMTGISFVGRLIELWILIIFSPFAFMSWTVPKFAGVQYLGWNAWFERLIATSFMAPIFMFFMYLIFMLIHANLFGSLISGKGTTEIMLGILIPAIIILVMLKKATEFAKKGGGEFGAMALKGATMVGGLALGAATGGAAMLATSTIGAAAMKTANNDDLKKAASGDKEHFARMAQTTGNQKYNDPKFQQKMQQDAQKKLASANKTASRSFDLRDTGLGKFVGKQTGMDFNAGTGALGLGIKNLEGGRKKQEEHKVEEEGAKAKTYELSAAAAARQTELAVADDTPEKNARVQQYKADREEAKRIKGNDFNEEDFKHDYEHGNVLMTHGLNKRVEAGSVEKVQTAQQVNDDRRRAYGSSLDNEAKEGDSKNTVVKKAVNRFFDNYKVGVGKMVATRVGAGVTLTAGALSGGIGLALAPVLGGFVHALKEQFKEGGGRSTNAELVAGVRKGEDKDKKLLKMIKESGNAAPTPAAHPPTAAPTPTPSPTSHTPPAGNATEHH